MRRVIGYWTRASAVLLFLVASAPSLPSQAMALPGGAAPTRSQDSSGAAAACAQDQGGAVPARAQNPDGAAATRAQDPPPATCCLTNPGFAGTCEVRPAKDESCGQVLDYLNNPMSKGKSYCGNTSIRGGWKSVACEPKK